MVNHSRDGHRVALIKSVATGNRFYALVPPGLGIGNADTVEEIPHDLLLGIAYPCLEDALNDFAVIRTAYETLEMFPDDAPLQHELHEIITDARRTLVHRLMELLERIIARRAHFLGTDLEEFKTTALDIMHRGFPRHSLDSMMKVNVFSSVAQAQLQEQAQAQSGPASEAARVGGVAAHDESGISMYRYEFRNSDDVARLSRLSGREFLLSLLADVLDSVLEDGNYENKNSFDQNVFQDFIALIFITYAATDPAFYGTHKDDYGVSRDKDMDDTPLYLAIGRELRRIADGENNGQIDETKTAAQLRDVATKPAAPAGTAAPGHASSNATTISAEECAFFEAIGAAAEALSNASDPDLTEAIPDEFFPRAEARDEASHDAATSNASHEPQEDNDAAQREPALGESVPAFPVLRAREELLLGPIASICATANQLGKRSPLDANELTQLILADASRLVRALKTLRLISPLAYDPGEDSSP